MNENHFYEYGPKGHSQLPLHREAFPLDDESSQEPVEHKVVNTDFEASYSDDDGDTIQAVETLSPYLYPKTQVILKVLIKINSIKHDVDYLAKVQRDPQINEVTVKPMSMREGLEIAQEMSPYLSSGANKQVNNAVSKLHQVDELQSSVTKIQNAETPEVKAEYILDNIKLFLPKEKYTKIKQIVNVMKLVESTVDIMKTDASTNEDIEDMEDMEDVEGDNREENAEPAQKTDNANEQLADIVDLIDAFSNRVGGR